MLCTKANETRQLSINPRKTVDVEEDDGGTFIRHIVSIYLQLLTGSDFMAHLHFPHSRDSLFRFQAPGFQDPGSEISNPKVQAVRSWKAGSWDPKFPVSTVPRVSR